MIPVFDALATRWDREYGDGGVMLQTPGELARIIDRRTVQTPMLTLLDELIMWAFSTPDARLIISVPPQEGKSTRVTKIGTLWALRQDPDRRIGIASYSDDLATDFGRDIRLWINSHDGTEGTHDLGLRISRDSGAAAQWRIAGYHGGVRCAGITGAFTGKALEALVIDDPLKDRVQAESDSYRKLAWDFWLNVGAPRLAPGAPVIVIMTRWHEDDLAGRLVAAEDGHLWRVVNIPAQADHRPERGETDPLGRQPGQFLVSARGRTPEQWEAIKKRSGTRVWNSLYQGNPSPDSGNVWKRHWWKTYRQRLWTVDPVSGSFKADPDLAVTMSWDMAFKDSKSSDWVVGQVWGKRGSDIFLLDQVRDRMSFTETVARLKALVAKWPDAAAKLVEDKANGSAVLDTLKSSIPGLIAINPTDSKYGRAVAVAPFLEAGNVWLPSDEVALFAGDAGAAALVDEASAFPYGRNDDMVDATSQALARLLLNPGDGFLDWLKRRAEQREEAVTGG